MDRSLPPQDFPEQHMLFSFDSEGRMKTRKVWKPTESIRSEHEEMLGFIRGTRISMPYAYGGIRGKSLYDHVSKHRDNNEFYKLDIADAYGSVDIGNLRAHVKLAVYQAGYGDMAAEKIDSFIENYAVIDGVPGLPLGYPCSPLLFNLYCRQMDGDIAYLLSDTWKLFNPDVVYTRWLDDLTISSPTQIRPEVRREVRRIVESVPGFKVSHPKSKYETCSPETGPVTVTGLSIYPDGRILPSPGLLAKVDQTFREAEKRVRIGDVDNNLIGRVNGMNSVLHMAGPPEELNSPAVNGLRVRYEKLALRSLQLTPTKDDQSS